MIITTKLIGSREFLVIDEIVAVPVDKIIRFEYNPPNGGCENSIAIILDDNVSHLNEPNLIFAYQNAEDLKRFLMT